MLLNQTLCRHICGFPKLDTCWNDFYLFCSLWTSENHDYIYVNRSDFLSQYNVLIWLEKETNKVWFRFLHELYQCTSGMVNQKTEAFKIVHKMATCEQLRQHQMVTLAVLRDKWWVRFPHVDSFAALVGFEARGPQSEIHTKTYSVCTWTCSWRH